ncbi:MAG: transcriptional repressor LexA [Clostridia bacterium]|nr:transcriptional repressor LexA [Clostridia bacterium]
MSRNGKSTHDKIYGYLQSCAGKAFPTVREIANACGIKSPSCVHAHLLQLEQEGLIERQEGKARSICIPHAQAGVVPLVGRVAAGTPITAVEMIEEYIPFSSDAIRQGETFALRVVGESMKDAGILPDDIVICYQNQEIHNGDIVVAMLEDEVTVKRFYREGNRVVLQPENSAFSPIVCDDVTVIGKVIAVVRRYI